MMKKTSWSAPFTYSYNKHTRNVWSSNTVRFDWIELITKLKAFLSQTVNAHSWTPNIWETDRWFRFNFCDHVDDCVFSPEHWIIERLVDNWLFQFHYSDCYIYIYIYIHINIPYLRIDWLKIDWLRHVPTYWHSNITVASKCATAGLKSSVSRLFVQQPVQLKTKERERKKKENLKRSMASWRNFQSVSHRPIKKPMQDWQ